MRYKELSINKIEAIGSKLSQLKTCLNQSDIKQSWELVEMIEEQLEELHSSISLEHDEWK